MQKAQQNRTTRGTAILMRFSLTESIKVSRTHKNRFAPNQSNDGGISKYVCHVDYLLGDATVEFWVHSLQLESDGVELGKDLAHDEAPG